MPKLDSRRVDRLLEDVIGCRWTISVLSAVASGVNRPGALERHIQGISAKVLSDRLKHFHRAGILERIQYPGNSTARRISTDSLREEVYKTPRRGEPFAKGIGSARLIADLVAKNIREQ